MMNQKEIEKKYVNYFKEKYEKFISDLIQEVENSKQIIEISDYTSRLTEKPKEIIKLFLESENINDFIYTDNVTYSLNYSSYLQFLSYSDLLELNSELMDKIFTHNKNTTVNSGYK